MTALLVRVTHRDAPAIACDVAAGARVEAIVGDAVSFGLPALPIVVPIEVVTAPDGAPTPEIDGAWVTFRRHGVYRVRVGEGPQAIAVSVVVFPGTCLASHRLAHIAAERERRLVLRSLARHGDLSDRIVAALTDAASLPAMSLVTFGA